MLEHGQNVGASPTPGMTASVEDAIKIDRVELPASGHSGNILIEPGNQSNVARTRFGWHSGMRDAECAMFQNARSEERGKWSRAQVVVNAGTRVRLGE